MADINTLRLLAEKDEDIRAAGKILKDGGLVVIPTETVYGLAADALNTAAVEKIFKAKGRPADNPLIIHVNSLEDVRPLVADIPTAAEALAHAFWPGPLTLILPKTDLVPSITSGGLDTVAVRVPAHPAARAVIKAAGCPLAAPSANLSGKPSPTEFSHAWQDMKGRADAVVDGGSCVVGLESTVITLAGKKPKILRPGGVTAEEISAIIGDVEIDSAVLNKPEAGEKVISPGVKYKHYAPRAEIWLSRLSAADTAELANSKGAAGLCFKGEESMFKHGAVTYGKAENCDEQGRELFSALHLVDMKGFSVVYARCPKKNGVGLAVYNRLVRAAGFKIIEPKHRIIGLTGETGAGKTTVSQILKGRGAAVIDCDAVTKEPGVYDEDCIKQLQNAFGSDIIVNSELNRRLLASRAFESAETAALLSSITLPPIIRVIKSRIDLLCNKGEEIIVLDAPTLFEAGADALCTDILAVIAEDDIRLERIMRRDGITREEGEKRMRVQKPKEFFTRRADFVIDTTEKSPEEQVLKFINYIKGGQYGKNI